jgi:hypothetical protein
MGGKKGLSDGLFCSILKPQSRRHNAVREEFRLLYRVKGEREKFVELTAECRLSLINVFQNYRKFCG